MPYVILVAMANVVALIDGFNMYGALNAKVRGKQPFAKYKWIDYWKLMEQFLLPHETIIDVFLFTTYPIDGMYDWKAKRTRHVLLAEAQRSVGVTVVKGRFAPRLRQCLVPTAEGGCRKMFTRHEEKRTDVNIAVKLVSVAYEQSYDTAFIVTADGDLRTAIEQAKAVFPAGRVVNVPPIGRLKLAASLNVAVDAQAEMQERHLANALLPKRMVLRNGRVLNCPNEWL